MSKILITGAAGGLSEVVAELLQKDHTLVGVDPRPLPEGRTFPGEFYNLDYRQRRMTEVFRQHKFHALIHLGRVPIASNIRRTTRFNTNVLGTRSLLDQCLHYGLKTVIVMSTFHVYGAHQHNHLYITEDDPLLASHTFPEITDAVELDNVSVAFSLKHRNIRTSILRPTNIIGTRINNQISRSLRSQMVPVLMGYDPLQQFIHEVDIANAVKLVLEGTKSGIYNVAGEGVIPFSRAIEIVGAKSIALPEFLSTPAIKMMKWLGHYYPRHLVDFFKYPTIISDKSIRKDFGYAPKMSTVEALRSLNQMPTALSDVSTKPQVAES